MLRVFQSDLYDPEKFVVTLELVPGRESTGRNLDKVMRIAQDAYDDGRISAVSMTDNPGGNPALSPDVLGYEIFKLGLDVIVHFTCRDSNRVGMESRALQLAMMGMKNILALTGDYSGKGFGGQGAPVFDLDSVQLQIMLSMLNERLQAEGDPDDFYAGCATSPFKYTEAESFAQYAKLCRKISAGAKFVITQLGYDCVKYAELLRIMERMHLKVPVLGSVYLLTPMAAKIMNGGKVPGAVVPDKLLNQVQLEWQRNSEGRDAAIDRAAQLSAVLKGLGYKGVHIGGIHRNFAMVSEILDRMELYEKDWKSLLPKLSYSPPNGYYAFPKGSHSPFYHRNEKRISVFEKVGYAFMSMSHNIFFNRDHSMAPMFQKLCRALDNRMGEKILFELLEHPIKRLMLKCRRCGDCGVQYVGFLCPESGCPKHMRNGACGGSSNGRCEVYADRYCIWVRAYYRLAYGGKTNELLEGCVPPRMWELNLTSSWTNFHLNRDHQGSSSAIASMCRMHQCNLAGHL